MTLKPGWKVAASYILLVADDSGYTYLSGQELLSLLASEEVLIVNKILCGSLCQNVLHGTFLGNTSTRKTSACPVTHVAEIEATSNNHS